MCVRDRGLRELVDLGSLRSWELLPHNGRDLIVAERIDGGV